LQNLTHGYGNGWVCRESSNGRGLRLHESELEDSVTTIREAIDNYLDKGKVSMGDTHINPNTNLFIQTTESAGVGVVTPETSLKVDGHLPKDIGINLHNSRIPIEENNIVFNIDYGKTEVLKFRANGDIFVYGRLAENDTEIIEGFRDFLRSQCLYSK